MKHPTVRAVLPSLALALVLAACSSGDRSMPILDGIKAEIKARAHPKPDPEQARRAVEALSRAQMIGDTKNPLILVDIEASQQYATLGQVSQNGAYTVFMSADNRTLTFRGGLLSATRGIGDDLMSLDVSQTEAALAKNLRGVVKTRRVHRRLTALNSIRATAYSCELSDAGLESVTSFHKTFRLRKYSETCRTAAARPPVYTNIYWLDPKTRVIRKSRQWVGATAGYFGIDVLTP